MSRGDDDLKSFSVNHDNTLALAGFKNYITVVKMSIEDKKIEIAGTLDIDSHIGWETESYSFRFLRDVPIAYHISGGGLTVHRIDLSDPYNPKYLENIVFDNPNDLTAMRLELTDDGFVFLVAPVVGILVGDVRNPEDPKIIGTVFTGVYSRYTYMAKTQNTIFLGDIYEGFVTVNITDRENAEVIHSLIIRDYWPSLDIELKPLAFSEDEQMAYLSTFEGVYLWVNLKDLTNPRIETVMEIWTYTFRIL